MAQARAIGPAGTAARIVAGLAIAAIMTWVALTGPVSPVSWLLGLVGFPAVALAGQWLRARRTPAPLRACGPLGHAAGAAVIVALLLTPLYAPPLAVTTNATAVFYGISMLVAAVRGYAGCEVLAVSNWLLRRDDQIGCLLFAPIDHLDRRRSGACPVQQGDAEPGRAVDHGAPVPQGVDQAGAAQDGGVLAGAGGGDPGEGGQLLGGAAGVFGDGGQDGRPGGAEQRRGGRP